MWNFIALFVGILPFTFLIDWLSNKILGSKTTNGKIVSFGLYHLIILPFIDFNESREIIWLVLTVLHGIAHIAQPAFYGTIVNNKFDPIYDYIVHAAQCLCIFYYHPHLLPFGIMAHSLMLIGSAVAHIDRKFFETSLWLFMSGCGVFGTQYHMMLLNKTLDPNIFYAGVVIWTLPYVGYLIPKNIPKWDYLMNSIGLFKFWFFNFFFAYWLYTHKFMA